MDLYCGEAYGEDARNPKYSRDDSDFPDYFQIVEQGHPLPLEGPPARQEHLKGEFRLHRLRFPIFLNIRSKIRLGSWHPQARRHPGSPTQSRYYERVEAFSDHLFYSRCSI